MLIVMKNFAAIISVLVVLLSLPALGGLKSEAILFEGSTSSTTPNSQLQGSSGWTTERNRDRYANDQQAAKVWFSTTKLNLSSSKKCGFVYVYVDPKEHRSKTPIVEAMVKHNPNVLTFVGSNSIIGGNFAQLALRPLPYAKDTIWVKASISLNPYGNLAFDWNQLFTSQHLSNTDRFVAKLQFCAKNPAKKQTTTLTFESAKLFFWNQKEEKMDGWKSVYKRGSMTVQVN